MGLIMGIKEILDFVRKSFEEKDAIREEAIRISRNIIRLSKEIISYIHRDMFKNAEDKISLIEENVLELNKKARELGEIYYSGIVRDSLMEYVEAILFYNIIVKNNVILLKNVPMTSYILGLADLTGELRRKILDLLDKGDLEKAEKLYGIIEEIYYNLSSFIFPEAIIPGFRKKLDVMKYSLERTKSEILLTKISRRY